jgi:hypothetical protein
MARSRRFVFCWMVLGFGWPLLPGACGHDSSGEGDHPGVGVVNMPLLTRTGEHLYRLRDVAILIEPGSTVLRDDGSVEDTILSATLPSGRYTANLQTWSLERDIGGGDFQTIPATLVSRSSVDFTLLNDTSATISYTFQVSGEVVVVGSGTLHVTASVQEIPVACPNGVGFVEAPDRVDAVYDSKRCRVYVSTQRGLVLSHDLRTGTTQELANLGGSLLGLDISPAANTLLVADNDTSSDDPNGESWVHVVDLQHGAARRLRVPHEAYEGGTFMPAFLNEDSALVSSRFQGSGWVPLREVDLLSDTVAAVVSSVRQDTMLSVSADRSTIAYAEANISNGAFGRFRPADRSVAAGQAGWFVYEIATNRDGSQYALPTYGGLLVFNETFQQVALFGAYAEKPSLSVAYSPTSDVLYASFSTWQGFGTIEAIDGRTFRPLGVVDTVPGLSWNGNSAFGSGRLRISPDGKHLLATVEGGVRMYPVGAP